MSTPVSTTSREPCSTRRRICSTTAPIGTERELPRPNGMMQKVQRWSQPFCTCTKARVCASHAVDQVARAVSLHRHDVVDGTCSRGADRRNRPSRPRSRRSSSRRCRRPESTSGIAAKRCGLDLRGAAGDDDARAGLLAREPADRLPRLARRFGGHGAGVDDDEPVMARRLRAWRRIASDSTMLSRQPKVTTSTPITRSGAREERRRQRRLRAPAPPGRSSARGRRSRASR